MLAREGGDSEDGVTIERPRLLALRLAIFAGFAKTGEAESRANSELRADIGKEAVEKAFVSIGGATAVLTARFFRFLPFLLGIEG